MFSYFTIISSAVNSRVLYKSINDEVALSGFSGWNKTGTNYEFLKTTNWTSFEQNILDNLLSAHDNTADLDDVSYQTAVSLWHGIPGEDIKIAPPTGLTSYTLTLPDAVGIANQYLTLDDGEGNLTWSTAASSSTVKRFLQGFEQSFVSATQVDFGTVGQSSQATASDETTLLKYNGVKSLNTNVSGTGGISSSQSLLQSTKYSVFCIQNTSNTGTEILAVIEGTNMISANVSELINYPLFRKIGFFRTYDNNSNIHEHRMNGDGRDRTYIYLVEREETDLIFGGSSTAWVDIPSADYVSEEATILKLRLAFGSPAGANEEAGLREKGSAIPLSQSRYTISNGNALAASELTDSQIDVFLPPSRELQYVVSDASNNFYAYVLSFQMKL